MFWVLSALLVALGRRVAGGLIGDLTGKPAPGVVAKLYFGATVGAAAIPSNAPWWGCIAIGFGAWLGHIVHGLNGSAGMGHYGPDNSLWSVGHLLHDVGGMTLYGSGIACMAIAVAACPVVHGHWIAPLLAALACAPCYALCWALWPRMSMSLRWRGFSADPLQMSEWMWGAVLGIGVFFA